MELIQRGYIEVETPVLQPLYGGAAARPFTTHHNALDMQLYLCISPELYLKRLLVGGLECVFEFSRCFRNEGISAKHNPEFTMLELYQAYGDYYDMLKLMEELICKVVTGITETTSIRFGNNLINFARPWAVHQYSDLFEQYVGFSMDDMDKVQDAYRRQFSTELRDHVLMVNALFEHYVERHLINPTFVINYPAALCPLTRRDPKNPDVAFRFECYINGMEVGNAYSELNDPALQRENFSRQLQGEIETMAVMDEDFVEALEYGMPPAGGLGIGIDRLVMLLTGQQSIRDVILFPLQKSAQE